MSLRLACMLFMISTSVYYYKAKRKDDSQVIEQLSLLADLHKTLGILDDVPPAEEVTAYVEP